MSVPSSSRARASSLSGGGTAPQSGSFNNGSGERRTRTTSFAVAAAMNAVPGAPIDPLASSSAASSQIVSGGGAQPSRADQIVYRFYLKTVGVLVDGRVTHFNKGDSKTDRWFNLSIPDTDVHKADLSIYRLVSNFPPLAKAPPGESSSRSTVPPLLIAFILDTNDIPAGQTLMWNRDGHRVALDPCLANNPAQGRKPGIVLERWTFRVTNVAESVSGGSEMAPPTAYRMGIAHFRALYAFIRLLPAYRLFRRLRRLNTGLRLGIKLWGPEGYPNTAQGLTDAWDVMERDLVGIAEPLERLIPSQQATPALEAESEPLGVYTFEPLELFGSTYELGVAYRPNTDFDVEDMESVLSERFVDMDEEWFTPTVARHRLQSEARAAASAGTSVSSRTTNPPALGTPPRVQPTATGTSATRQTSTSVSRASGSIPKEPSSLGAGKWTALAEGLPFASGSQLVSADSGSPIAPSPTGTATASAIPYRRLSAHSLQPFRSISASPSTSILRPGGGVGGGVVPFPGAVPRASISSATVSPLPGSLPRTSEFLSSSGRSFSHAQMANMMAPHGSSPPVGGSPPFAPGPLSFTKQAVDPMAHSSSSPFIPSSLDRDTSTPWLPKRYSGSFSRRLPGSGNPADGGLPASLNRRQSTRESGLRHSIDEPRPDAPDNDDVHAFLRALDSWTPPASIAPHSISPRATMTGPIVTTTAATPVQGSNASSISASSHPSPRVSSVSGSAQASTASMHRTPLTRQHVDDMLKRMVGSFTVGAEQTPGHSGIPSTVPSPRPPSSASQLASRRDSYTSERSAATSGPGLLSASRPSPPQPGISPRSNASPLPGSSLRHGSFPRTGALPFAAPAHLSNPVPVVSLGAARSLPATARADDHGDAPGPLRAFSPPNPLSPQTTGGTDVSRRRGPVLVRGGFGAASSKASTTGSSPSHSPVRGYSYRGMSADRDRDRDRDGSESGAPGSTPIRRSSTLTNPSSLGHGYSHGRLGRTAPSSLGADVSEDSELELATGAAVTSTSAGATLGGSGLGITAARRPKPSEGSTSPAVSDRSQPSPVVEGMLARLALADKDRAQRREEPRREEPFMYYGP